MTVTIKQKEREVRKRQHCNTQKTLVAWGLFDLFLLVPMG
ncbi:MAG: hypothetical protein ACI8RD_001124 [Bacillariaceae sp.]|jgi:hypothetical protein